MITETEPDAPQARPAPDEGPSRSALAGWSVRLQRFSFVAVAVVSLAGASMVWLVPGMDPALRPGGTALFAAVGLLSLAGLAVPPRHAAAAMAGVLAAALAAICMHAVVSGWGLVAPGLAFSGLFVCILCVAASARLGAALAAAAALAVALAWAGSAESAQAAPGAHLALLAGHWLLIGTGLAAGWVFARTQRRVLRAAEDRERRFVRLLALATDAYWETDPWGRLSAVEDQRGPGADPLPAPLGRVPWDEPTFACEAQVLDALLAAISARQPFRELVVRWQTEGQLPRSFAVSGEPRFDDRGGFAGYWGVVRDITAELRARRALDATEARYQALFRRLPNPVVLHHDGRVVDANPAALALLGQEDLPSLAATDLLAAYADGDSRERARRAFEWLESQPQGAAVAVADYTLEPVPGRRLVVRSSSVRVETGSGPATLTILADDTERKAAEEALRRSEGTLSHLVATSPEIITLTELDSGRYTMVNRTFEQVTGYAAAEVVGRRAVEVGIWVDPADREAFVRLLREQGSVHDVPARLRAKDGRVISMLVSGARFAMDGRDYLVVNARDVTQAERERLEREAILEGASVGIAVTRDDRFVLVNPAFEHMLGWRRGSLAGQAVTALGPAAPGEGAEADFGPCLGAGEAVEFERLIERRGGGQFLARVVGRAIDAAHPAHGGTVWLVEDVTERRRFEQQLARARDQAEAASRAKSAFLANMSHELRTPLNGIIGLARLARDPAVDEDRRRLYLDQVLETSRSLADIISDILDLQKIEAGKLRLQMARFEVGALLSSLQRLYQTLADAHGLALVFDTAPEAAGLVLGDELRVRQIVGNYLSNAVKFTARGEVRVTTRRLDGERVRFEVRDTGPGMAADVQAELFKPFSQADASTTRRFGGTGLGLSICHELAALMGGRVGVLSEPGRGSLFWAELPLPAMRGPAPAPAPEAPADAGELRGTQVLLAEDNAVNAVIAEALLERWGIVVTRAADGAQAVAAARQACAQGRPFDAVLMDIQMPVMSGYEATRQIRQDPATARLPVIALTAAAMVSERQQALEVGMDDFLTKPIDADRLRAALQRWIGARRAG